MCCSFHSVQSTYCFFLFFVIQFYLSGNCFAQQENLATQIQALRFLQDSARIDCLNQLSYYYITIEKKIQQAIMPF